MLRCPAMLFTFQYVSINTIKAKMELKELMHLHSNMFLLIQEAKKQ